MFEWFQEGTNIGFGMILRPLKLATWLELLKDLEKKKDLHFDFLVKWELVNFGVNKWKWEMKIGNEKWKLKEDPKYFRGSA